MTEDKAAEQGGRSPHLPGYNPTFFCHFMMLCWNYIPFLPLFFCSIPIISLYFTYYPLLFMFLSSYCYHGP